MITPALPDDAYPDDVDFDSTPAREVAGVLREMSEGIGLLDGAESFKVLASLVEPYTYDLACWREAAMDAGARHEPETRKSRELTRALEAIDRLSAKRGCPHHGMDIDLAGRCTGCGLPLPGAPR